MPNPNPDLTLPRRDLLRALVREAQVAAGTIRGKHGFTLVSLSTLPDDQLACLVPAVSPAYTIDLGDDCVWARPTGGGQPIRLFSLDIENTAAFNLFNGQNTLGDAGRLLAAQLGWDQPRAFAHVRALFLDLVRHMVCLPSNFLE
jgi:hypothetical protein